MSNKAVVGFGLGVIVGYMAFTKRGREFLAYSARNVKKEISNKLETTRKEVSSSAPPSSSSDDT